MTEFEEMCKKANVKVEALCDTVLTRHLKGVNKNDTLSGMYRHKTDTKNEQLNTKDCEGE